MAKNHEKEDGKEEANQKSGGPVVRKRFAVFIDYLNLEKNIKTPADIRLDPLLDPLIKEGRINWIYVYIPESAIPAPINILINRYQVLIILCSQEMGGGYLKDKDNVDFQMDKHIRSIVEHTDVTDIVIFSGDADFFPVASWAHQQGITVHVKSIRAALSRVFEEDGRFKITKI